MSTSQEITKDDANEVISTENGEDPDLDELPPPVVTRTRSGRRVRPPAFLDSQPVPSPVKTPARRSRKSVIQELPGEENPEIPAVEHIPVTHDNITTHTATDKADGLVSDVACNGKETEVRVEGLLESAPAEPPNKKKRTQSESSEKRSSIPLGKPKSGRVWKDRNKQRFSSLVRDKPLCTSWGKKMEAKREKDLVKKYCLELKGDKAKKKEDKRKRREENLKRREENERKGEVVQVIRNTSKIKRMKKKQLRKIEKRDTLAMLQKTQPRTPKATGDGTKSHRKGKQ